MLLALSCASFGCIVGLFHERDAAKETLLNENLKIVSSDEISGIVVSLLLVLACVHLVPLFGQETPYRGALS